MILKKFRSIYREIFLIFLQEKDLRRNSRGIFQKNLLFLWSKKTLKNLFAEFFDKLLCLLQEKVVRRNIWYWLGREQWQVWDKSTPSVETLSNKNGLAQTWHKSTASLHQICTNCTPIMPSKKKMTKIWHKPVQNFCSVWFKY